MSLNKIVLWQKKLLAPKSGILNLGGNKRSILA
jgi:hypothetical protein